MSVILSGKTKIVRCHHFAFPAIWSVLFRFFIKGGHNFIILSLNRLKSLNWKVSQHIRANYALWFLISNSVLSLLHLFVAIHCIILHNMPLSFLRNSLRRVPNTSKLKKTSQFRLNALTRQTSRHVLQQRRNFYFSVPFVVVPGLIAFVSITVYQVYKKQQRDGKWTNYRRKSDAVWSLRGLHSYCVLYYFLYNICHVCASLTFSVFIKPYLSWSWFSFFITFFLCCLFFPLLSEIDALENSNRIQWRAKEIIYYGKKYAKRDDSNEVYDIQSYNNAIKAQNGEHITPILVGYWDRDEDGKQCIRMVGGEDDEAAGVGEKKWYILFLDFHIDSVRIYIYILYLPRNVCCSLIRHDLRRSEGYLASVCMITITSYD